MSTSLLENLIPEYSRVIKNTALYHDINIVPIIDGADKFRTEEKVRYMVRQGDFSSALNMRLTISLYCLEQKKFDETAFQLSRAGNHAHCDLNYLLNAHLRHISSLLFLHIIDAENLSPQEDSDRYYKLAREACFGLIYASEIYASYGAKRLETPEPIRPSFFDRKSNEERLISLGKRCWGRFKPLAEDLNFSHPKFKNLLRFLKRHIPELQDSIDKYCDVVNLQLYD